MATPADGTRTRGRRPPARERPSGDDRERALLATAERVLAERGWAGTSVDDLARGAGLSRPAFYFYFASKEAVLLALLERVVAEARARRDAAAATAGGPAAAGPEAFWRGVVTAVAGAFADHRAVVLAATHAAPASPAVRALWEAAMERFVDETAAAVEAERARGAAPPGVDARDLAVVLNLMDERVLQAAAAGERPGVAGGPDAVVDVLLAVWLRAVYGSPPA